MGTRKFATCTKAVYQEIRGEIRTGDILLCSGEYAISKMIRQVSGSDFSHVGFVFTWNDRVVVLESVEDDGVRAVPLSHYLTNYENSGEKYDGSLYLGRLTASLDAGRVTAMLGRAVDLLNRKYDKSEIAKIALRITTGMGRYSPNDEYICSEFVEECFNAVGVAFQKKPGSCITPEDIAADSAMVPLFEIMP